MENNLIELDARGLEPPQPLMKTLNAIATLPDGATLRLHTRWRPALLYALEKRGFTGQSQEQSDGSYLTYSAAADGVTSMGLRISCG